MLTLLTDSDRILNAFFEHVNAGDCPSIAIAFWGRGASAKMGLDLLRTSAKILLNADSGACNPAELRTLLAMPHIEVRNAPRLHAKVIISGDCAIIGSANASANGLGFQGSEACWNEACVEIRTEQAVSDARRWFGKLWKQSQPLREEDILRAEEAWQRLRRHALAFRNDVEAPRKAIEEFDGAPIFVALTDEDSDHTRDEVHRSARAMERETVGVDYFQAWTRMPKQALLLAYTTEKGRCDCEFEKAWKTTQTFDVVHGGKRYNAVHEAKPSDLLTFGLPAHRLNWREAVNATIVFFQSRAGQEHELRTRVGVQYSRPTEWCLPLYEFLQICRQHKTIPAPWISQQIE